MPRFPILLLQDWASLPEPNALAHPAASTQRAPGRRFSSNALRLRASRTMNSAAISVFARALGSRSRSGRGYSIESAACALPQAKAKTVSIAESLMENLWATGWFPRSQ